jgi:hypothetical protein
LILKHLRTTSSMAAQRSLPQEEPDPFSLGLCSPRVT